MLTCLFVFEKRSPFFAGVCFVLFVPVRDQGIGGEWVTQMLRDQIILTLEYSFPLCRRGEQTRLVC